MFICMACLSIDEHWGYRSQRAAVGLREYVHGLGFSNQGKIVFFRIAQLIDNCNQGLDATHAPTDSCGIRCFVLHNSNCTLTVINQPRI
ncbi:hypothetical protein MPTK1_3g23270 [Marchantia polymorpha subsp. ruderalis]|uniref:Uncharacterized protein n=2 Tax=Marchantia polymorpha TaxID=3197 RepID=A0AAF6B3W8_MARPO|nr:hypothetical protein MARPO_0024s0104 [Marchantia polymorpha]BBN06702.1 hypothetical protein Mp_3g23270 [Marchantia polymorpha subsp. ruderalis]|eukprot:PTQ43602.1 hypothetical protein MARPO_0024s0104 [Marchantia polymorpha]